ncbi:hypothetical protein F511_22579 [Dorcoceras hygrometricum]|uniref:Uncharacterized protein n=1 Tax=Dorcoceras hygrometricum TaxID=472368 RepID=A0A2Z7CBT3_9LAMI|nr:hypothetical protein F511_22579 [Dorcoceras hygrometricum]
MEIPISLKKLRKKIKSEEMKGREGTIRDQKFIPTSIKLLYGPHHGSIFRSHHLIPFPNSNNHSIEIQSTG